MQNFLSRYWPLILLALIVTLGAFLRFFLLSRIPPGLYPDVAMNGIDSIRTAVTRDYRVFYPANNGREGLYINLIAISYQIFGVSIFALKFISAVVGTLTIIGTYLLTKEFFAFIRSLRPRWYHEGAALA